MARTLTKQGDEIMWLIVISLVLLGISIRGVYEWGKRGETFDEGELLGVVFFVGVFFMLYGGYHFGKGNHAEAADVLSKGMVYSVESVVSKDKKVYATVTSEYGNVYAPIFNKPPPAKFKVVDGKNGQEYIAVP